MKSAEDESLNGHLATPGGQRLHQCHICERILKQADHLKTHMVKHTDENEYQCTRGCGETYTRIRQ